MSDTVEVVYSSWYNDELAQLSSRSKTRIESKLQHFLEKGWMASIRDRTVTPLRDGIYELRVVGTGPAFRLLFFVMPGRSPRIVVLTTCATKSAMSKRARLDAEVERAAARRSVWLEEQRKRENDEG